LPRKVKRKKADDDERRHRDDDDTRRKVEHDHDRVHIDRLYVDVRSADVHIHVEEGGHGGDGGKGGDGGNGGTKGPTATPFLLIPSGAGDSGARPIPVAQAVTNGSIQANITNPLPRAAWQTAEIQLSCLVQNQGAMGCAAGLAEFYVGDQFSTWNPGHETLTPAQVKANAQLIGIATFQVPPGATVTVTCPKVWVPGGLNAAQKGVLVQVYDLFTDRLAAPFDAIDDRPVARNDDAMDCLLKSVIVSGKFLPPHKVDSTPTALTFTDATSGTQFPAAVANGQYTVMLPDKASYLVMLTITIINLPGTSNIGTLKLNAGGPTFTYNISW
jgi:hypothetical protein